MKAARVTRFGTGTVEVAQVDPPVPRTNQVLISVRASSINPIDTAIAEGRMTDMQLEPPLTLGVDVAGVVAEIGADVRGFAVGDEVFGTAGVASGGSGAWAESAVAPATMLARRPRNLGFVECAAAVLAGTSAAQALHEVLNLQHNQRILIHGGAGGIGTIAIQIARHLGAHVTSTATGAGLDYVARLGADQVIDYQSDDFTRGGRRFDAVLDTVGGDVYRRSFEVVVPGGAIVSLRHPVELELARHYDVKAFFQLTRTTSDHLEQLHRLIEEHVVKVFLERTFPLERIKDALAAKQRGRVRGKLGIEMGSAAAR